jgi:uroporphyrinogen-III synthase
MSEVTRPVEPTIWITRTAPAAFKSAELWAKEGYAAAVAPILEVSKPREMPQLPARDGVVIFTSGNAAKAFADMTLLRHWPVVTPGYQTQRISHDLGFRTVTSANGTSDDVTKVILRDYTTARPIYHCSGNHVRGSITEDLTAKGYRARRDIYYLSAPVTRMPNVNMAHMDFIALYSPLAAKTLAGFAPDLTGTTVLCLSKAVEEALGDIPSKAKIIAEYPNELSLIDTLKAV